ncbi:hypothetical protein K440DRAFT_630631 [Wilcoxina mikolae CBS 423.85]|nr:hypothetical protein K440DRAFT_630631 [Wilcoxina mikolae CBS 423.85]
MLTNTVISSHHISCLALYPTPTSNTNLHPSPSHFSTDPEHNYRRLLQQIRYPGTHEPTPHTAAISSLPSAAAAAANKAEPADSGKFVHTLPPC